MQTSIYEAEDEYELELGKIASTIKKENAKLVLLQFPEKMKQYAPAIATTLEEKTKAKFLIWLGNCWGACDIPRVESDRLKIDLVVQFGHSAYNYESGVAIFS